MVISLFGVLLLVLYLGFMSGLVTVLAMILAQWMPWQWAVMIATPIMMLWTAWLLRPVTEEIGHE